ncbi:MAG: hypothetical protein ABWX83_07470 [Luteibacter sp.]
MRAISWIVFIALAVSGTAVHATTTAPIRLTACELVSDPGRYDHAMVEVSGRVEHGFEQFDLEVTDCVSRKDIGLGVWLEYGGTRQSQTKYCCVVATGPDRQEPLVVEGITCHLVVDDTFERFHRLLHARGAGAVNATVVGRFFAGRKTRINGKTFWGGFGHTGMSSLLVIEQVRDVQAAPASPDVPVTSTTAPLPPIDTD